MFIRTVVRMSLYEEKQLLKKLKQKDYASVISSSADVKLKRFYRKLCVRQVVQYLYYFIVSNDLHCCAYVEMRNKKYITVCSFCEELEYIYYVVTSPTFHWMYRLNLVSTFVCIIHLCLAQSTLLWFISLWNWIILIIMISPVFHAPLVCVLIVSYFCWQQQRERNIRVFDLDSFMQRLSNGNDAVSLIYNIISSKLPNNGFSILHLNELY